MSPLILALSLMMQTTQPAASRPAMNPNLPTLFIVGDSTAHNPNKGQKGWGDVIGELFDRSRINVENRARGGRSSRTYQTEGLWDQVLADMKPGDFVLIQFGTNDGGPLDDDKRARGSIRGVGDESREIYNPIMQKQEVVHTYGWYMRKYVADARARGATPIIVSWIPHCPKPDTAWPPPPPATEPTSYALYAGDVARAEGAAFIDLYEIVNKQYATLQREQIKEMYFCVEDFTHTNPAGARLNAESVVQGVRELKDCSLKSYLTNDDQRGAISRPSTRG
jgi:lysophospholipase L1-like esterase